MGWAGGFLRIPFDREGPVLTPAKGPTLRWLGRDGSHTRGRGAPWRAEDQRGFGAESQRPAQVALAGRPRSAGGAERQGAGGRPRREGQRAPLGGLMVQGPGWPEGSESGQGLLARPGPAVPVPSARNKGQRARRETLWLRPASGPWPWRGGSGSPSEGRQGKGLAQRSGCEVSPVLPWRRGRHLPTPVRTLRKGSRL